MTGDSERDIVAAQRAGVGKTLWLKGDGSLPTPMSDQANLTHITKIARLDEAIPHIELLARE